MPENEQLKEERQISRRQFLKNAGIVVGGSAIGSSVLLAACQGDATETVTSTVKVTTSVAKFICPYDSNEFDSFAALQAHVEAEHEAGDSITKYVCPYDNQEFGSLADLKAHLEASHLKAESEPGVITLIINEKPRVVKVKDNWTLAYVLREKLGLTGTKRGCDEGACGVCTVIMNNRPVLSCMVLASQAAGSSIATIEGLAQEDHLDPVQQAFLENDGLQCGFCTPGQIMTAKALLSFKNNPSVDEIKEFLGGNLCRCGAHPNIVKAVQAAS